MKDIKKTVILNIPYVLIAIFATKLGQAVRLAPGFDFASKALHIIDGIKTAFESPLPSFHPFDLCVGVAIAGIMRFAVYIKNKNANMPNMYASIIIATE